MIACANQDTSAFFSTGRRERGIPREDRRYACSRLPITRDRQGTLPIIFPVK